MNLDLIGSLLGRVPDQPKVPGPVVTLTVNSQSADLSAPFAKWLAGGKLGPMDLLPLAPLALGIAPLVPQIIERVRQGGHVVVAPPPPGTQPPAVHPAPTVVPVREGEAPRLRSLSVGIVDLYHDWFRKDGDDENTAASLDQINAILAGGAPLPPGAIINFGVSSQPDGLDVSEVPIPLTAVFTLRRQGADDDGRTDTYVGDPVEGDGDRPGKVSKMKPGRFGKSRGWNGLLVTYAQDEGPSEAWFSLYGDVAGQRFATNTIHFPWVGKARDAK